MDILILESVLLLFCVCECIYFGTTFSYRLSCGFTPWFDMKAMYRFEY